MKVLTDKQHADLLARADSFSQIVAAIVESGEDITAEDITAETVIQMVQASDVAEIIDLQPDLDTATARITELETELETAHSRVAELEADLDNQPAEAPATITAESEVTGEKTDILDFAKKNQDNPFAVIEAAKKQGLI